MKLAILFGSSSNEHEVSVISAASIIKNLDKSKYDIVPIYMDKNNSFYFWHEDINNIKPLSIGILPSNLEKIHEPFTFFKQFNLVFIMVHGKNGEDGILSSIFDFLNIKYVANNAMSSILTMDKILAKNILETNNIKTAPYFSFVKYNNEYLVKDESLNYQELITRINETITYPIFVKPANSGSSIGITKVNLASELENAINLALEVDNRILIEEMIVGKEVECGILEKNGEVIASEIGEVVSAEDFYSFSAKYTNKESVTLIPAHVEEKIAQKVRDLAIKAFKILNLHGYSRCDFFVTNNNEIILNEINTVPGFTEISMYPKLFEASGIPYNELLDTLIIESLKDDN